MVRVYCQVVCHTNPKVEVALACTGIKTGEMYAAMPKIYSNLGVAKDCIRAGHWELHSLLPDNRIADSVACWLVISELERCFHINDVQYLVGDPGDDLNEHIPDTLTVSIPGDTRTYACRTELRELGGVWDSDSRRWILPMGVEPAVHSMLHDAEQAENRALLQTHMADFLKEEL